MSRNNKRNNATTNNNDNANNDANATTTTTTRHAITTRDDNANRVSYEYTTTHANNAIERDNAIDTLLIDLSNAKHDKRTNECKSIRRRLRALSYHLSIVKRNARDNNDANR